MLSRKQLLTLVTYFILHSSLGFSSATKEDIVDLTDRTTVIKLIDPSFKNDNPAIRAMQQLGKLISVTEIRTVKGSDGRGAGQAYCCHPEALAKFIPFVRGKKVLEIAGASGENGAFLAFSGAKEVYVNELQSSEKPNFEKVCSMLPKKIQPRLKPLWGDIFDVLQKKHDILTPGTHILCRNFLHMLDDKQIETFFSLIKPVLGKEGTILLSVNSFSPLLKDVQEEYPLHTRFIWTRGEITDHTGNPVDHTFSHMIPDSTSGMYGFEKFYPYTHCKANVTEKSEEELNKLLPEIRTLYLEKLQQYEAIAAQTPSGKYSVIRSNLVAFNEKNFRFLLNKNGFECLDTFLVNPVNGHKVGCTYPDGTKEKFNPETAYQLVAFAKVASTTK